jgi:hypothetical protein
MLEDHKLTVPLCETSELELWCRSTNSKHIYMFPSAKKVQYPGFHLLMLSLDYGLPLQDDDFQVYHLI